VEVAILRSLDLLWGSLPCKYLAFHTGPGDVTSVAKKPGQKRPASVDWLKRKASSMRSKSALVFPVLRTKEDERGHHNDEDGEERRRR
jgi:hypothetical protein